MLSVGYLPTLVRFTCRDTVWPCLTAAPSLVRDYWYGYGEFGLWGADMHSCEGTCSEKVLAGDGNCDWKNNVSGVHPYALLL